MRNLKKILALVLALVMSLSLMATASAKDFTDASQISDSYKTAAEVLAGLEVFRGDPDGSFRPTDSITRSEVAAVIYRIATADVNDTQQAIYTNHPFTDVVANHWATGYISYCYNAEYVKGNGDNTFSPDAKVTGYATLAMILRAMGYGKNGEFEGDGWEIRTASTAKQIGILDKITDAQLGGDATRELVAQILFRALLTETAEFDARLPYQYPTTGETLGYKQFGLEEISGVVVANEYADLNSDQVLADGRTQLETEDGIKNLAITTEITDIGESRYAYITGTTVLAMGDTGKNNVTEFGSACDITTNAKFNAVAEMTKASDIEFYVNFDRSGYWTSDFRIEYEMAVGETTEAWRNEYIESNGGWFSDDGTIYHKIIPATDVITNTDYSNIRNIFYVSNGKTNQVDNTTGITYIGKVFVATQTKDDISDEISFNQFVEKYLNDKTFNDNWGVSYNGEWVKFVDNNGDGQAEYAFKTESWLDEALETYTNKNGETVTVFNWFDDDNDPRAVNGEYQVRYMDGEVPAVGTKVIAAWIDNQILVEPANDETATVSSYSWRDDVITTDKGEFGQSGIGNATDMLQYIATMADKTEYIMYLDHFGYVRAYEWPGASNYALVTEIYARNNANGNLVRDWPMTVELVQPDDESKNGELAGKEYGLNGGSGNLFVTSSHNNQYAWSMIDNYSAQGNYYNWLQPATAHMGVNATGYAPSYGVGTLTNATYTYWSTNRQAVRQITALTANDTFDYGAKTYGDIVNAGTVSFTNVAIANIDGDNNATLEGASRLKLDKNGNVMFFDSNKNGVKDANERDRYAIDYVQLDTSLPVAAGAVRYPIGGSAQYIAENNNYVNAVHDTQYFIVHDNGVYYCKDFASFPGLTSNSNVEIHAAYAVAKDVSSDNADAPYWVADVIVYEVSKWNNDKAGSVALAYYTPTRTTGDVQNIDTINAKYGLTQLQPGNRAWNADQWQWGADWEGYGFYKLTNETEPVDNVMKATNITRIPSTATGNYGYNNIHAGIVTREAYIANGGYYIDVDMTRYAANGARAVGDPKIVSIEITDKIYSVTTDWTHQGYPYDYNEATLLRYQNSNNSQVKAGDRVIWVGEAKSSALNASGVLSSTNFVIDLGNPVNNVEIWENTANFLAGNYLQVTTVNPNPDPTTGEWVEIMEEQMTPAAPAAAPTMIFYGEDADLDENTRTFTAEVEYVEAADGTTNSITVNKGTIVMTSSNSTISDNEKAASTTKDTGTVIYTGTVLGEDGKYYTYSFTQKAQDRDFGEVFSTNQKIAWVRPNNNNYGTPQWGLLGTGIDGRYVSYLIDIQDPAQVMLTSLANMLDATDGCTVVDVKAYDSTLTKDEFEGKTVVPSALITGTSQTCETAMWFKVTMKNSAGETLPVWMYRAPTAVSVTASAVTIVDYYKAGSGLKAYWAWPDVPVSDAEITKSGDNAVINVGTGMELIVSKSGLTANTALSSWTVTTGGAVAGPWWHEAEGVSNLVVTNTKNDDTAFSITYTAPAPTKTVSIQTASTVPEDLVTLPATTTWSGNSGTASFAVTVPATVVPVVTDQTGAVVSGTQSGTTWTYSLAYNTSNPAATTWTLDVVPATITDATTAITASVSAAGVVTVSGLQASWMNGVQLKASDVKYTYSLEILGSNGSTWTTVSGGDVTPVSNLTGTGAAVAIPVTLPGTINTTGTYRVTVGGVSVPTGVTYTLGTPATTATPTFGYSAN